MCKDISYGDFAYVYDMLTDDVEYQKRADYIHELVTKHFGAGANLLCDLGCGTGTVCALLQSKGYDCIGIDNSQDMLNVACQKNKDGKILFLNQDICEFELFGTVDVFISMLDTVNYITEPGNIEKLFKLVNNYLNHGGIFIFDVNSLHKFRETLGNNTFVFENNNVFYTWENYYEDELLEFYLNFFVEEDNFKYTRFSEVHRQRYYSHEFLLSCAKKANLNLVGCYGDLSTDKPKADEERVFYVLKKSLHTENN